MQGSAHSYRLRSKLENSGPVPLGETQMQLDRELFHVKTLALMDGTPEQHSYLLLLEDGLVFLKR